MRSRPAVVGPGDLPVDERLVRLDQEVVGEAAVVGRQPFVGVEEDDPVVVVVDQFVGVVAWRS